MVRSALPRSWPYLLAALLLARVIALFLGLDRIPRLSNNDESLMNDAALALSRGLGLIAPSYPLTPIAKLDSFFPPLYAFLQGIIFRLAGFSPLAVRATGALFNLATCATLILVIRSLVQRRIWTPAAAIAISLLAIVDMETFYDARLGRMDSMAAFLGFCSVALVIGTPGSRRWIASGLLCGLALATHLSALYFYCFFAAAFIVLERRRYQMLAIPPFTAAAIWCLTWRTNSITALHQLLDASKTATGTNLGFRDWINAARHPLSIDLLQHGGPLYALMVLGWVAIGLSFLRPDENRREWIKILALSSLLQIPLLAFITGTAYPSRQSVLFPLTMLTFGFVLSSLPYRKRIVGMCVAAIVIFQTILIAGYLWTGIKDWNTRDPQRFATLIRQIRQHQPKAVGVSPALWYAWQRDPSPSTDFYVIDYGCPYCSRPFFNDPQLIRTLDVIVLPPDHPFLTPQLRAERKVSEFRSGSETYLVLERRP